MINWPINTFHLAVTCAPCFPRVLLICSDSESVQHRWGLMAVCKFPEERVNKVHKQPATSANLQDYGVKTHVHQDTRVINCRAAHSGQGHGDGVHQRLWEKCKREGPMQKGPGRCHSSFPGSLRPQPEGQAAPDKESSPSRYLAPHLLPSWYTHSPPGAPPASQVAHCTSVSFL